MLSKPITKYNVRFYLNIFESYSVVVLTPVRPTKQCTHLTIDMEKYGQNFVRNTTTKYDAALEQRYRFDSVYVNMLYVFLPTKTTRTSLDLYLHM